MLDIIFDCYLTKKLDNSLKIPVHSSDKFVDKRIAHAVFSLGCGGAERQLVTTLEGLKKAEFEHYVVAGSLNKEEEKYYKTDIEKLGIKVVEARLSDESVDRVVLDRIQALPKIIQQNILSYLTKFDEIRPQIVHVWSDNIYAAMAAVILGVPRVIVSFQSISPKEFYAHQRKTFRKTLSTALRKILFRSLCRNEVVLFTANSKAGIKSYAAWMNLQEEAFRLLYNGMDASKWINSSPAEALQEKEKLGLDPERPVVLGLMRMQDIKRPDLWISVAERLKERANTKFVLYGDGPLYAKMKPLAGKAGVIMPGLTSNPASCLGFADVFLHTAKVEGLPNVLLEAQLMGVPVVATQAGGSAEAVLNGRTGFVLEEGKDLAGRLAGTVAEMLENHEWRREAGNLAPVFVQDKFSIETMLVNTMKLYE